MPPKHDILSPRVLSDATFAALGVGADLDPALLALSGASDAAPIDPQLFTIEQVVHDVRAGRVDGLDASPHPHLMVPSDLSQTHAHQPDLTQNDTTRDLRTDLNRGELTRAELNEVAQQVHAQQVAQQQQQQAEAEQAQAGASHDVLGDVGHAHGDEQQDDHIPLDDDGIDPALREIVNSLTNAQQSHHPIGDNEERERLDRERLQHTLQTTLEDFAQGGLMGSYNEIFATNFPQSPPNLVLPLESEVPVKRGRGRPKGSKNKPKLGAPPPPPPPPKRPRGRPPKIRTQEEIEEEERRKQEKELGIHRKRGRPRKYPEIGLVREMRLKKNRAMFAEKIRQIQERDTEHSEVVGEQGMEGGKVDENEYYKQSEGVGVGEGVGAEYVDVSLGQQVAAAVARQPDHGAEYWSYQDGQSLLDVVGSSLGVEGSSGMGSGMGMEGDMGGDQGDEMRGVFTLPEVPHVPQ